MAGTRLVLEKTEMNKMFSLPSNNLQYSEEMARKWNGLGIAKVLQTGVSPVD